VLLAGVEFSDVKLEVFGHALAACCSRLTEVKLKVLLDLVKQI
jgi:hypothetical protein